MYNKVSDGKVLVGRLYTTGGATITSAELEVLDGVTAGTVTASKAVVVDANKDIGTFRNVTLSGNLVSGSATLSSTELGYLDGLTAGTVTASKALVVDASKNLGDLGTVTATSADVTNLLISSTTVSASATELNHLQYADKLPKTIKVALSDSTGNAGVFSWQNTEESSAVIVTRCVVDVTTASTAASTINVGQAASSTGSDNLLDGLDVGSATGVFDNIDDAGTNGQSVVRVADNEYVTAEQATGTVTGLGGNAYITYVVV